MAEDTLSITDNRTGKQYKISVTEGTIRAMDLRQIKVSREDFGLMSYDPGFTNTACCRSAITFIDGGKGVLRHRGYPIEQLAGNHDYLSVAYLLIHGELPEEDAYQEWVQSLSSHMLVDEDLRRALDGFHHDSNPMAVLISLVAGLSTLYPEAKNVADDGVRNLQIRRLIAKMPTLAAAISRHQRGLPPAYPRSELSYTGSFLHMMFSEAESSFEIHPVLERALDVLFILHADHEQNCSANAMRSVGSSRPDPYVALAAAIAALSGPLHGGANEAVLRMLQEIQTRDRIPGYVEKVKAGEFRLMGFGHRVYKNYDPRARIIKKLAYDVFEITGSNRLLDIALELERIAMQDEYFVSRKLFPNVDFYSGLIYQSMGFPSGMFPVLFAVARTAGWLAQWDEMMRDPEQTRIARPRQVYVGHGQRSVPGAGRATVDE